MRPLFKAFECVGLSFALICVPSTASWVQDSHDGFQGESQHKRHAALKELLKFKHATALPEEVRTTGAIT